jgi:hypothetical protein
MALGSDGVTGHFWLYENSAMRFATNNTERMRIDSVGNVLVGSTSFAGYGPLQLGNTSAGSAASTLQFLAGSAQASYIQFGDGVVGADAFRGYLGYLHSSDSFVVATSATERMRIDSSGNLLVGTTNSNETQANGFIVLGGTKGYVAASMAGSTNAAGASYHLYSTGANAYRFYVGLGGTIFATSTTISALSDVRHKENIQDLDVGLDAVMALKPRKFDWKEGKGKDIKGDRGFIAQEFEQIFPDLIDEWKDPSPEGEEPYKSVRADLIPVLVKAIQEQQAIIEQLKADVAALKGAQA